MCYNGSVKECEEISEEELRKAAFPLLVLLREKGNAETIVEVTISGARILKWVRPHKNIISS